MIVGSAVATIELSTAGMKIAISAAISTRPRRGTATEGRAFLRHRLVQPRRSRQPEIGRRLGRSRAANNADAEKSRSLAGRATACATLR